MKATILYIFLLLIFFTNQKSVAQSLPIRRCATMEQDSINRKLFPMRGSLDEFEQTLQTKIKEIEARRASGKIESTIITIPIIVHVVHNGEAVGSGTNISQAQVMSQIEVLNEDYRKKLGTNGYNTNPVGADVEVEFCLSPVDENGNTLTEPGIHRVKGSKQTWTRADIDGSLKPTTIWNPNFFYNVWTLKFGGTDSNLLGYAQFPDQSGLTGLDQIGGPATTDGVVVQYSSFGSSEKGTFPSMQAPYNKGRTLSHETGHWLGLRHIWGDGVCGDDFVADTPTQQKESRGCPTTTKSCDGLSSAMVQNYMDYSDDACMNIFTKGQKARIQAVLETSPRRKSIYEANLCSPIVADVPTPEFTSDKQSILLGGTINFIDLSSNFPSSWSWIFESGNPNTSTLRNPKIKYSAPGVFKVTLTSTNSLGSSTPLVVEGYVTVSSEGLCGNLSNFKPNYTPSTIKLSSIDNTYKGYLTGHNSLGYLGFSELFQNSQGYTYISGVKVNFGKIYTTHEDATATITVWNARGPQNAPGSIIETKQVLLKEIQEDIQLDSPTVVTFDRETPIFGRPYQVGIQINYDEGDSIAVVSSANGEATNASSWFQDNNSVWSRYSNTLGENIALDIEPIVGVNPSVQVSSSKLLIYPGEEVILNGRGASIFVWSNSDGSGNYIGPQYILNPTKDITIMTIGSGLELCNDTAYTKIYISDNVLGIEPDQLISGLSIYPNPGNKNLNIKLENSIIGNIQVELESVLGISATKSISENKDTDTHILTFDTSSLPAGIYLIKVKFNNRVGIKKWIKQ